MAGLAQRLPDFPWDTLAQAKAQAAEHPDGVVDLSIGTPVDPTPAVVQSALIAAADSPGYPQTTGAPATRDAVTSWVRRRLGARDGFDVLPTIGTKEFVAWLPTLLDLGPADVHVEDGYLGGKGSDAHKAAVVGDTVGDPFKDTSGPSMNILIKLMAVVSLVFAPVIARMF